MFDDTVEGNNVFLSNSWKCLLFPMCYEKKIVQCIFVRLTTKDYFALSLFCAA